MKLKFAEIEARVRDAARVREIREAEAKKIELQFAPIRRKAANNIARLRVEPEVGNFRRTSLW